MKTYHFFKANLAGKGYTLIWAEKPEFVDLRREDIEDSLPLPDTNISLSVPSYAASLLTETLLIIAVGCYWPDHVDEFGRPGLSFWHGILCVLPQIDQQQVSVISNLLIGLTQRYELGYEQLGEIVALLANQEQKQDWTGSFVRLTHSLPSYINDNAEHMITEFMRRLDQVPEHANLRVSFPLHKQLAISLLVSLMLYRRKVRRVGGGALARTNLGQFQHVSITANIPDYIVFDVSELLHTDKPVRATLHATGSDSGRSNSHQYSKLVTPETRLKAILVSIAIIVLFSLTVVSIRNIASKTVEIQGTVVDARTEEPISAEVRVNGKLLQQNILEFPIELSSENSPTEVEVRAPGYVPWAVVIGSKESREKLLLTIQLATETQ